MVKIISAILVIGAALVFLNRHNIEDYKQRIIEVINPAVKEKRLLGELEKNLDQFSSILMSSAINPGIDSGKISAIDQQKLSMAVKNAKTALQELQVTNQKNDLVTNLSNLIQKIIPLSSEPSPTWLPPGQECQKP